jgi:hypothetical protein
VTAGATTTDLVQAYYGSWKRGIESFDEERLRGILAPDLRFEGPIAGKREGREPFIKGVADFARSLKEYRAVQLTDAGDEASALYDCSVGASGGELRFAEFFRVKDGLIQEIRLVYDPSEFRRLTAPA